MISHSTKPNSTFAASAGAADGTGLSADGVALADGPARDALRRAMQQLSEAEAGGGQPAAMCQALTEAARALAGLQANGPAESYLAQALRWAGLMGGQDQRAELLCALAEVATNAADLAQGQDQRARCRGHRERARDHAFEAARLAAGTSCPDWEIRVLLRASDVLDRCGDHDDAAHLQHRALVLMGLGQPGLADAAAPSVQALEGVGQTAPATLM